MNNPLQNRTLLIEIQCFGNVYFWSVLKQYKSITFEQFERFQKTGYRNRYHVLGSNGVITLSIPLVGGRENKEMIREVKIDATMAWQKNHWKTLESCYNKSPFFYHYSSTLQHLYQKSFKWLWDFNEEAFEWAAKQLKLPVVPAFTEAFIKKTDDESIVDFRGYIKTSEKQNLHFQPYSQVFGTDFQKNLSILDLIFNLGPNSSSNLSV